MRSTVNHKIAYLYDPVDIDTTKIEMLPDDPSLFAFPVVLSGTPDDLWKRTFYQVWKESRYLDKLACRIDEDRIRFICRQSQGLEDYLYFIEARIRETNRRMESYWKARGYRVETVEYTPYPPGFRPIGVI